MHKNLSVIIPAYNEANYLRTCLEAVLAQTVEPDEIIVVDNNSTDNTAKIVRSFPSVELVQEARQGLFFARNKGMNLAQGNIIARIDADTVVGPTWVETIKDAFDDPAICAASGPVGYYDMPFQRFTQKAEEIVLRMAKAGKYDFVMGANMAIRRSVWQDIRSDLCNEPTLFEDIDIAVHLREHNLCPTYIAHMRADVSSRRFADTPRAFYRYAGGNTRTWEYHGHRAAPGAHYARAMLVVAYMVAKPLHLIYDPILRRPSLAYLLQPTKARPDPMTTGEVI